MIAVPHPEQTDLWRAFVDAIRPRERMRPSAWSEQHVVLEKAQSDRAGPFSCDLFPWGRDVHDVMHDNPGKRGVVGVKPAQIGWTRAMLNVLACLCVQDAGPFLFVIGDDQAAAHYAVEHFDPMTRSGPLAPIFDRAAEPDRRELMKERPYLGGRLDFAGGGSPGRVSSRTYRVVMVDELEIVLDNFKASAGSPVGFAEARTSSPTVKDVSQLWFWSHPRSPSGGIIKLYKSRSDQRAWMFDCPHCQAAVDPTWSCVHFEGLKESGPMAIDRAVIDPAKAVLRCPACGAVISDRERIRAVWPARLGGSGRFESRLSEAEAAKCSYVGLWINGLASPYNTVADLAAKLAGCSDDAERQTFFNLTLGEGYEASSKAVTVEHVAEAIRTQDQVLVPGGMLGVHYVAVGVDVQHPPENPTLYARVEGYAASGVKYVTHFEKCRGWAALLEYLRLVSVRRAGPDGDLADALGPLVCGIDCAWLTTHVLDFCRTAVYSAVTNARIQLLPMRYQSHVKSTMPAVMPPEVKRIDPSRPHLGPLERYDLHRNTWVGREMNRWQDGRVIVLASPPEDLKGHITANVLRPGPDIHGWGNPELVWELVKGGRDDWMQAGAYAEAAACLKLGLDRIHELGAVAEASAAVDIPRDDWLGSRRLRGGGRWI